MPIKTLPATWGITLVRMMMGIILIVAGLEKFAGGGLFGFSGVLTQLGVVAPQVFGPFIPVLEFVGGVLMLAGFGARWVAVLFICEFFVNVFLLKSVKPAPFGGWDSMRIDLMMLATAVAVFLVGPGELALDRILLQRRSTQLEPQYR